MKFDFSGVEKKKRIEQKKKHIEDELCYLKRVVDVCEGSLVDAKMRIKLIEDLIQEIKNV